MVCKEKKIIRSNFVEFIIVGEKYNLKIFLLVVIDFVLQCDIINCIGYSNILNDVKVKILIVRVCYLIYKGFKYDIDL